MDDTFQIRYSDLFLWMLALLLSALVLGVLICFQPECKSAFRFTWRSIGPAIYTLIASFFTLISYFFNSTGEIISILCTASSHLPFAWYVLAALTVVPICIDIGKSIVILYLGIYCVFGFCICNSLPLPPPKSTPGSKKVKSQFFDGLRITVN